MPLQIDNRISTPVRFTGLPSCPSCGEALFAPEHSEFHGSGRIRHYWSCDACGQESQTSIKLKAH
jgi:hypothetical protein